MPNLSHLEPRERAAAWKGAAIADASCEALCAGNPVDFFKSLIEGMPNDEPDLWRFIMAGHCYRMSEHIFKRELAVRRLMQEVNDGPDH